jgi:uncharacterized protein (DUF1501 family)
MITIHSRRAFLKRSVSSAALVALAPTVPQFLLNASTLAAENGGETILVVIQLSGGNDGLNTVVPYADDVYKKGRPLIGITPARVLKIDDYVGLHPSMDGFSKLLQEGKLGIVQGVGYPNPNRSHFSSMDIWQTARNDVGAGAGYRATGWLGRALDINTRGAKMVHDLPALHLSSGAARLPLALVGDRVRAASVQSLDSFKLDDGNDAHLRDAIAKATTLPRETGNDLVSFIQQGTRSAIDSSRQVQEAVHHYKTDVVYPGTGLAQRLKTVAQLIDAGLRPRIYYLELDGFDTHANQPNGHAALLGELSGAMTAFMHDLKQHGHDRRVLAMTFSEFGRRVKENASQGTDHGAAAPLFIAGGRVKPGLLSKHPSMTDLDAGDVKFTVDFRGLYASVLQNWLGIQSEPVLGGKFDMLPIIG